MSSSDSEDTSIVIEEGQEEKKKVPEEAPFEANAYINQLIGFIKSKEKDANEKFAAFVKKTWELPADSANFYTDSYSLDSGGVSKLPPNMMMGAHKRIAGTQRLMFPPPPGLGKSLGGIDKSGMSSAGGPSSSGGLMRKPKKQIPVIDDSIYCTTDQPCKTCGGVSLAGNQVLVCKRCRDCYHMKCSIPPVSIEEASVSTFVYHCKTCLISRKVMHSSRSRSPSPAVIDAKKMKIAGKEKKLSKP
ncbi:hypothetical protein CRE_05537 [Caenorhabditis remanei]|uniref:Uncharacterized protein n=1 Tax=Caenorhabditis remanei TaxID=31234 RepID=E3LZU1_CAERE|nr:hypothetical protein CRE_05537 [Caenorhabditis remanei]